MKIFLPIIAVACLAGGCIGCGSDSQIVGPPVQQPPPPSAVAAFPALTHSGAIYGEQGQLYAEFSASQSGLVSRYVVYDDGSFELQFISGTRGFTRYAGTYSGSGTSLTLDFAGSNTAGPWQGTASLSGDQMSVKYNVIMMLDDFIDGVYVEVPPK